MRLTENQITNTIGLCVNLAGGTGSGGLREGARCATPCWPWRSRSDGRRRPARQVLEGMAASTTLMPGAIEDELAYSFVGDTDTTLDRITANLGKQWLFLETLYRIYSLPATTSPTSTSRQSSAKSTTSSTQDVDRVEAVVNWLETQYPSPAFPTQREDLDEPRAGSTRYYTRLRRGQTRVPACSAVTTRPARGPGAHEARTHHSIAQMTLFGPRITIFTKDGKSYTKQATGREFIWDFNEEVRRIREVIPGSADTGERSSRRSSRPAAISTNKNEPTGFSSSH